VDAEAVEGKGAADVDTEGADRTKTETSECRTTLSRCSSPLFSFAVSFSLSGPDLFLSALEAAASSGGAGDDAEPDDVAAAEEGVGGGDEGTCEGVKPRLRGRWGGCKRGRRRGVRRQHGREPGIDEHLEDLGV
jgi:hypothetical protein